MRWHYTKKKNLKSIIKTGLRASSGGLTYFIQDGEDGDEIEPGADGLDARVGVADDYPMVTMAEVQEMDEEFIEEYLRSWRMSECAVPASAISAIQVSTGYGWADYSKFPGGVVREQIPRQGACSHESRRIDVARHTERKLPYLVPQRGVALLIGDPVEDPLRGESRMEVAGLVGLSAIPAL